MHRLFIVVVVLGVVAVWVLSGPREGFRTPLFDERDVYSMGDYITTHPYVVPTLSKTDACGRAIVSFPLENPIATQFTLRRTRPSADTLPGAAIDYLKTHRRTWVVPTRDHTDRREYPGDDYMQLTKRRLYPDRVCA